MRHANPQNYVESKLATAIASNYPALRQKHVADYQSLFSRISLNLGSSRNQRKTLSTESRRESLGNGIFDLELVSLYFQYGRYLLHHERAITQPIFKVSGTASILLGDQSTP